MTDVMAEPRAKRLLKLLIERYIQEGQPVGSKTLSEQTGGEFSSATIRNVLADLEEEGYLKSPHTSAGRIPTAQGIRLFIEGLIDIKPLSNNEIQLLSQSLNPDNDISALMHHASELVSNITHLIGLVSLPRQNKVILRHIEFLSLSEQRVLVILVLNEREVQNRIIHLKHAYSKTELQRIANYLNQTFAGKELVSIRQEILKAMQTDKRQMDELMQTVLEVASKSFAENETEQVKEDHYLLAGQERLLGSADEMDLQNIRSLFEAFTEKKAILDLLDRCLDATGIQIFIGEESGYHVFDQYSVVTSPYSVDDETIGVLGVIGPRRMNYSKVIPTVDMAARLLGYALSK